MRFGFVTFIGLCIFVGIPLVFFAIYKQAEKESAAISREFRQACESAGGKAVYNMKYWECLK